jgi:hypothetical protein
MELAGYQVSLKRRRGVPSQFFSLGRVSRNSWRLSSLTVSMKMIIVIV